MARKVSMKSGVKILMLLSVLAGILMLVMNHLRMEQAGGVALWEEPMTAIYEIKDDALGGFDIFQTSLRMGPHYELNVSTSSGEQVAFWDDLADELMAFQHLIELETPQDTLYVTFENFLRHDEARFTGRDTFVMKLFFNYEATSFRPLNQEVFMTNFFFSLQEGHQVQIPIQLSDELGVNDYLNHLTVAIFATPERHTIDPVANLVVEGFLESHLGVVRQFDVTFGGRKQLTLAGEGLTVYRLHNSSNVISVSPEFSSSDINLHNGVGSPPSPWRAIAGEEIVLAFTSNVGYFPYWPKLTPPHYPTLEDYLIIGLLNWQQVELNGQPYLMVNASNRPMGGQEMDYGFFSIIAPLEPGFYDFIAFVVPNPTHPRADGVFFSNGGMPGNPYSIRFTIEVVEN